MAQPGLQYPGPGENQDQVNKNVIDNLFFLRGTLSDIQEHTITLAKLTPNGKAGSITFNQYGIIIGFTDPT